MASFFDIIINIDCWYHALLMIDIISTLLGAMSYHIPKGLLNMVGFIGSQSVGGKLTMFSFKSKHLTLLLYI